MPGAIAAGTLGVAVILVLGGFMAAFTIVGAVLVFVGLGCALAGLLGLVRLPLWLAAGAGAVVAAIFVAQIAIGGL